MSESQATAPQPVESSSSSPTTATSAKNATADDEEARRIRKEKKLAMKMEARARSKDKRKANKQEKKQHEKEENAKKIIESLSAPFDASGKNSTFDPDRLEMLRQLKEITEDKSRAGKVDHQILPFVGTLSNAKFRAWSVAASCLCCVGLSFIFDRIFERFSLIFHYDF